jgi:predicted PurR-regulated permease PerM
MNQLVSGERSELWQWVVRGAGLGIGLLIVYLVAQVVQVSIDVLVLVLVSVLLASALDPLVGRVRNHAGISRVKIILTIYVLLVVMAVTLALLIVPAAMNELTTLSTEAPKILADGRAWLEDFEPAVVGTTLTRLLGTVESTLTRGGITGPDPDTVVEFGLSAADAALAVITVLTLVFFWLISRETMQRFALALLPMSQRATVRKAWNEVEERLGFWFRGQLLLMLTVGSMATVAYFVLGLENALLLGVIAGLTEIIPIIGPAIGAVPALISAFVSGGPELALLVAVIYIVIQFVEGNVLVPVIMKNAVGLPPFIVIISLLVGGAVAGLIGALLAVPVAAAIAVVLEHAQARTEPVSMEAPSASAPDDEPPSDDPSAKELGPVAAEANG